MSATVATPAVVPSRRGPDIIQARSIPLSATTDQPRPDAPAPPTSASSHPDDQARGVAREITAEELRAAETAKRGVTADPESAPKPAEDESAAEARPDEPTPADAKNPEDTFEDGIAEPRENTPGWYRAEIGRIRGKARKAIEAAFKAARGQAGEQEWQRIYNETRDQIVAKANDDIAKANRETKEAVRTAEEARKALDEARAKPGEPEDKRPTRDAFDDPDAYDDALVAWSKRDAERTAAAAQKAKDDAAAAEKSETDRKAAEAENFRIMTAWTDQVAKAKEKYADFEAVTTATVADGGPTVTEAMAAALVRLPNGAEVAYHLGQNPEESIQIASKTNAIEQFIEIGRLAERLAAPPPRIVRRARPVEHVDVTPAPADTTEAEPGFAELEKRYLERQQRRPFFPASDLH